ncbi:hypothetical protein ACVW19_005569 [Streptomyces sp. TE5632]
MPLPAEPTAHVRQAENVSVSSCWVDRDEFDLEAVVVLQRGGMALRAAGVRMPVGERQMPAVSGRVDGRLLDRGLSST